LVAVLSEVRPLFAPSERMVKKLLESLIEKEYLEGCTEGYRYLP